MIKRWTLAVLLALVVEVSGCSVMKLEPEGTPAPEAVRRFVAEFRALAAEEKALTLEWNAYVVSEEAETCALEALRRRFKDYAARVRDIRGRAARLSAPGSADPCAPSTCRPSTPRCGRSRA